MSTSTSRISRAEQHLCKLNMEGIQLMQQGNYLRAAKAFEKAMETLRDILMALAESSGTLGTSRNSNLTLRSVSASAKLSSTTCSTGCPSSCGQDKQKIPLDSQMHYRNDVEQFDNYFAVFDQVFVLGIVGRSSDSDDGDAEILLDGDILLSTDEADVEFLLTASLMYNMGLALHMKGLAQNTSRDFKLAIRMYQRAGSFIDYIDIAQANLGGHALLVLLAILNNMAHIQTEELADIPRLEQCIDTIKLILDTQEAVDTLSETEYTFFRCSCVLFPEELKQHVWLSPAA